MWLAPFVALGQPKGLKKDDSNVLDKSIDGTVESATVNSWQGDPALIEALKPLVDNAETTNPQRLGFVFSDANTGRKLVSYQPDAHFHPASNIKLLTSAVALRTLGPRYRWNTEFRTRKRSGDSIDSLIVIAGGDPSFSFGDLSEMVEQLGQIGIKKIKGSIILDTDFFSREGLPDNLPPGYADKQQDGAYRAPISALNLNWNHIVISLSDNGNKRPFVSVFPPSDYIKIKNKALVSKKVKRVSRVEQTYIDNQQNIIITGQLKRRHRRTFRRRIEDPVAFFGSALRTLLSSKGIRFSGKIKVGSAKTRGSILVHHASDPLADILKDVNSWSNNVSAEVLVLTLAKEVKGTGKFAVGMKLLAGFAREKLKWKSFDIANGSGLFGETRVTPSQLVTLLNFMHRDAIQFPEYRPSLAVSGSDGTLRQRLKGLQSTFVHAKTGTLDGVSGLSGYLISDAPRVIAFSILQNDFKSPAKPVRQLQDRLVRAFLKAMK